VNISEPFIRRPVATSLLMLGVVLEYPNVAELLPAILSLLDEAR
jgi:hypothetical protein